MSPQRSAPELIYARQTTGSRSDVLISIGVAAFAWGWTFLIVQIVVDI